MKHVWLATILIVALLTSCVPNPTPTPTAIPTSTPTPMPTPTRTLAPTDTPTMAPVVWHYVALGDGFTLNAAWPSIYASYLEKDLGVQVKLYQAARGSQTILGMLQQIKNNAEVRQEIAQAQLITVNWCTATFELPYRMYKEGNCGGADGQDCLRALSLSAQADWQVMLDELVKLRSPREAHFITFRNGTVLAQRTCDWGSPCWEGLLSHVVKWNDFIERSAPQHGMLVVDLDSPFTGPDYRGRADGRYYQSDGICLSQEGSVVVADLLRKLDLRAIAP